MYCACHGGGGKGRRKGRRKERRKGRREERRLTCSICLLNTTRPAHQGESERASERTRNEQPCLLTNRTSAMHHRKEDREHGSRGKKEMIALAVTSRGLKRCHVKLEDLSCIPNYCEPSLPRSPGRREERVSERAGFSNELLKSMIAQQDYQS